VLIIYNPNAGRRRAHLLWRVLDTLVAQGIRLEVAETCHRGHAEALARAAAAAGESTVVAAGGDGTIAEIANGLAGYPTKLGIIPLGTANVLARELGFSFQPRSVAEALAFGRTRRLWPGCSSGTQGDRLFVQMLGVGFDAHVVQHLSPGLKAMFGRGAYVMQTLAELIRYPFAPVSVRIDGQQMKAASVIVSKGRLYGGPFLLAPEAQSCKPGFSVIMFERSGPLAALHYGAALPLGLLPGALGVRHIQARDVEFDGNAWLPAQADGDFAGFTPLRVTDTPQPIQVIVGNPALLK